MSNESVTEDIKEHVKDTSVWMRLLYMVLFAVLNWVAKVVLAVVVLFQFLMVLFTGKKNDKVLELGAQTSTYVYQIYRFLTFNSEDHPFPLGEWPSGSELKEAGSSKAKAAATAASADAKKPARKRAPAKKKAPAAKVEPTATTEDKPTAAE